MVEKRTFDLLTSAKSTVIAYLILLLALSSFALVDHGSDDCKRPECYNLTIHDLGPRTIRCGGSSNDKTAWTIFCFQGLEPSFVYLWTNPVLRVTRKEGSFNDSSRFITYTGDTVSDVRLRRDQSGYGALQSWLSSLRSLKPAEDFSLGAFNTSCIGIETNADYTARVAVKVIDLWYLAYLALGILIFFSAKTWSHNTTLHYGTGVSVGVLASLMILLFVVSKFLPQRLKSIGYALLFLGSSTSLWALTQFTHFLADPVANTFIEYWQYVVGYVIVMGIISFGLVYRYGPVTDSRTLNLIQWFLQAIALVLVYNSTQIREVSVAFIILILTVYCFPKAVLFNQTSRNLWYRFFPPKIRLLTEDEYMRQGDVETRKQLESLREFCRSPNCKAWKVVSQLKDPHRFADFIEGTSHHLTDEELLEYDSGPDPFLPHISDDDESEMDFILSSP